MSVDHVLRNAFDGASEYRIRSYLLPESRAGQAYQSDIEAVLRDKYRLKVETSRPESILQWFLLDGELPPCLTVRTNGTVVGTPNTYRAQPYQFRVRVVDQSAGNAQQLVIPLSIVVEPPGLRLARIDGPTLVPYDDATPSRGAGPKEPAVLAIEEQFATREPVATPVSASARPVFGAVPPVVNTLPQSGGAGDTQQQGCDKRSVKKAVSDEAHTPLEGDTSTQNTCVKFKNLNTLKYRIEFSNKTTRTEGPDISSLPFLPKLTLTGTSSTGGGRNRGSQRNTPGVIALTKRVDRTIDAVKKIGVELKELDKRFNSVLKDLNTTETTLRTNVEEHINLAVSAVQNADNRSIRLANGADFYLQSNNVKALLTRFNRQRQLSTQH